MPHEPERREPDEGPDLPRRGAGQAPALLRALEPPPVLRDVAVHQQAWRRLLQPRGEGGGGAPVPALTRAPRADRANGIHPLAEPPGGALGLEGAEHALRPHRHRPRYPRLAPRLAGALLQREEVAGLASPRARVLPSGHALEDS